MGIVPGVYRPMLFQDIRFGFRTALKNKGVTGVAVACLAIGIGLNTMMFSVTDGVLIQPLPYQAPDRLIVLHTTDLPNNVRHAPLSWLELADWRGRPRTFSTPPGGPVPHLHLRRRGGFHPDTLPPLVRPPVSLPRAEAAARSPVNAR